MKETDRALQDRLDRAEQERDALERRVQNLAAIVTSETWDALHDSGTDSSSLPERAQSIFRRHRPESDNRPPRERAAELARRLQTEPPQTKHR